MRESTARKLAWSVGIVSILLILAALLFMFVDRRAVVPAGTESWSISGVLDMVINIGVPVLGIVIATRRRENPIGWLFLAAGLALGIAGFSRVYAIHALVADPGSLPAGRALAWVANWIWPIPVCLLPFLFLLFPTGRLVSRRWRPVAWVAGAVLALLTSSAVVFASSSWSHPFNGPNAPIPAELSNAAARALGRIAEVGFLVGVLALPAVIVASFVSVGIRFRRSTGEERLQLKLFVTAAALVAVTLIVTFVTNSSLGSVTFTLALLLLYAAIGVALVRYRLYDADVVISRTVVFGSLAAFITVVYVGLVVGVGTVVGNRGSALLSALAAAIVAVAFQPVRERARRLANRLVYGERATPYEVLSNFSERIAGTYSSEDVLPRMAQIVAAGTGAERTTVWLRVGDELRAEASSNGTPEAAVLPVVGDELPEMPVGEAAVPVAYRGALLGAISVRMPPEEPLDAAQERLVADVASQAGLVLSNVKLIQELRASRQRLVAAQDGERRKLERNLHDGAQQQLVALAIKLGLLESLAGREPDKAQAMAGELKAEAGDALENLRDLARGIYPPLLADKGLAAALGSQARKAPVPVAMEAEGIARYPEGIEAAVYFCCLEALQNIAKYAGASAARIGLVVEDGSLRFEIADDGCGFDPASTAYGTGLQGMADRLDAIGGTLHVRSKPGAGTTVTGRIPSGLKAGPFGQGGAFGPVRLSL